MYRKRDCSIPGACLDGGMGVGKMLKFYIKVSYVIGKTLSCKLSCNGCMLTGLAKMCGILSFFLPFLQRITTRALLFKECFTTL